MLTFGSSFGISPVFVKFQSGEPVAVKVQSRHRTLPLMFADPVEVFTAHRSVRNQSNGSVVSPSKNPAVHPERRARVRTTLHWPVVFFRNGSGNAIESTTQNLSSNGFYFHSRILIAPGEFLLCAIKLPVCDPSGHAR